MSIKVMSLVWEKSAHTGGSLLVLLALADWADDSGGRLYPSVDRLAHKARLSARQTQRVLRQLEESGEIFTVTQNHPVASGQKTNQYRINLRALSGKAAVPKRGDTVSPVGSKGVTPTSPQGVTSDAPKGVTPTSPNTLGYPLGYPLDIAPEGAAPLDSENEPDQPTDPVTETPDHKDEPNGNPVPTAHRDPVEDMMGRALKAREDPAGTTIRAWNLPEYQQRICISFTKLMHVTPVKKDKTFWAKGAEELYALHPTFGDFRKACERAQEPTANGGHLTITHPMALKKILIQILAERKAAEEAGEGFPLGYMTGDATGPTIYD